MSRVHTMVVAVVDEEWEKNGSEREEKNEKSLKCIYRLKINFSVSPNDHPTPFLEKKC